MDSLLNLTFGIMFLISSMTIQAQDAKEDIWPNHQFDIGFTMRGSGLNATPLYTNDTVGLRSTILAPRFQIGYRYSKRSTIQVYADFHYFRLRSLAYNEKFLTLGYGIQHQWAFREWMLRSKKKSGAYGKFRCYPIALVGVNVNRVKIKDPIARIPGVGTSYGFVYEIGSGMAFYISPKFQLEAFLFASYSETYPYAIDGKRVTLVKLSYKIF